MLLSVPTSDPDGVPEIEPSAILKVAQSGLFWTLKATASPVGFWTVGVNEYGWPTSACVEGEPAIDSAEDFDVEAGVDEVGAEEDPDTLDAGSVETALPPHPAVTPRRIAQTANMLVLRGRLSCFDDIRLPSTLNENPRTQSANSPDSKPPDQGIAGDEEFGICRWKLFGNPAISIRGSRPEALRLRLAAGLPRKVQIIHVARPQSTGLDLGMQFVGRTRHKRVRLNRSSLTASRTVFLQLHIMPVD